MTRILIAMWHDIATCTDKKWFKPVTTYDTKHIIAVFKSPTSSWIEALSVIESAFICLQGQGSFEVYLAISWG